MAIINMIGNSIPTGFSGTGYACTQFPAVVGEYTPIFPAGTYAPIGRGSYNDFGADGKASSGFTKASPLLLYSSFAGKCLKDREMNGYDDSDFYMTVWDDAINAPREIMFATTRGWSYPCYSSAVDATAEVKAKYEAFLANARKVAADKAAAARAAGIKADAKACGVDESAIEKLMAAYMPETYKAVAKLLATKKFKSEFRKSLADQVRNWLADAAPKYPTPLSMKQVSYL